MNAVADAGITAHGAWEWFVQNWIWALIIFWFFGGAIEETWRRIAKSRRKALERHREYRIRMAYAKRGLPYAPPGQVTAGGNISGIVSTGDGTVNTQRQGQAYDDRVLPDAVIPRPPEAQPVSGVPGQCRHGRIVPVITDLGGVEKWICANWVRGCPAEFDRSVAVYAGDLEDEHD